MQCYRKTDFLIFTMCRKFTKSITVHILCIYICDPLFCWSNNYIIKYFQIEKLTQALVHA